MRPTANQAERIRRLVSAKSDSPSLGSSNWAMADPFDADERTLDESDDTSQAVSGGAANKITATRVLRLKQKDATGSAPPVAFGVSVDASTLPSLMKSAPHFAQSLAPENTSAPHLGQLVIARTHVGRRQVACPKHRLPLASLPPRRVDPRRAWRLVLFRWVCGRGRGVSRVQRFRHERSGRPRSTSRPTRRSHRPPAHRR